MEKTQSSLAPRSLSFRVSCDAGNASQFQAEADSVRVRVGQRARRGGAEEIWDSVAIESTAQQDGTLVLRIIIFNPDWGHPQLYYSQVPAGHQSWQSGSHLVLGFGLAERPRSAPGKIASGAAAAEDDRLQLGAVPRNRQPAHHDRHHAEAVLIIPREASWPGRSARF